jgi:hypothetical protein
LWKQILRVAVKEMREVLIDDLQPVFALIRWLRNRRR